MSDRGITSVVTLDPAENTRQGLAEAIPTIKVRVRVCVYEDSGEPGVYRYYLDDGGPASADIHVVWLEADVPVRPQPMAARALA